MANPNPGRADSEIDKIFMAMACLASKFSKDPDTKVGACIVSQDGNIVSTGYNSIPEDTKYPLYKMFYMLHAEQHAIMNAFKTDLSGCTIYTTLFPVSESTKMIIQAGIKKVVYLSNKYPDRGETVASGEMLDKASVECRPYPRPRDTVEIQFSSF